MDIDLYNVLRRFIDGDADENETKRILSWLEESPENKREYVELRKLNDLHIWNSESVTPGSQKRNPVRRMFAEILKIAAVFMLGIFGTLYFIDNGKPEEIILSQTIRVPAGQRVELTLSDGTEVWLNSGSTFVYPEKFSTAAREVKLDGEAYFKVKENKDRLFTVKTLQYDVRVLGTEFNVKAYDKGGIFMTSLLKGSVEVSSPSDSESLLVKPNEQVTVSEGAFVKEQIADYNYFKWREGLICFEKETIALLFAKLELYYDTKIEVRNKSLLGYTYTGKFRIRDGVEHVLKVLQLKHDFKYIKNEELNTIVIE
ncbi:MAG: FecR domain-containing protein [Tannerella sp.]|jgi:ferric-dicitrate binding protein FerR (iron transport regulator)|nr:FecR domain-containing protein [Tannerella sp.]